MCLSLAADSYNPIIYYKWNKLSLEATNMLVKEEDC